MRTYGILLRRELGAYFVSLSGYVVIAAAAFLMGLGFLNMVIAVRGETMLVPVTELFYQTPYFWMIVLLTSPIITMRLFALEKYAGTFETLMTTPVRDTRWCWQNSARRWFSSWCCGCPWRAVSSSSAR